MPQAWKCVRGATLLIPSGPNEGQKHLFALLLDPVVLEGYGTKPLVLTAGVTTIQAGIVYDDACVLTVGDHPFVQHDSFVIYRYTRLDPAETLEAKIGDGSFVAKEPCSDELIKKIIGGALRSKRISQEHKKILEQVLFS